MSDDTPTQSFPTAGSDTPTQRIDTGALQQDLVEGKHRSNGLIIGLIIAGALLLAAIIAIAVVLIAGNQQSPIVAGTDSAQPSDSASAQPTDSGTPSSEPTDDAPPPSTAPAFSVFTPVTQVKCEHGGPGFTPDPPLIQIRWQAERAESAWIIQGTDDAADARFMEIPLFGDEDDFPYPIQFPCFGDSGTFTITLVGTDGSHLSKSWDVTNIGERD